MSHPKTLLELAGADLTPSPLSQAALMIIDAQNEYLDGTLALPGIAPAMIEISALLARARKAGRPVVHVRHIGSAGGLFDSEGRTGRIIDALEPERGEAIIEKTYPDAFAETLLPSLVEEFDVKQFVVTGFMTHMCVSSTVRSALEHGLFSTVVASACATRDLPSATGGDPIPAATVHDATLAALADRFAVIAANAVDIPD